MVEWTKNALIWLAISMIAGAAGWYFLGFNFWGATAMAGGALIVNGFIAEWEDRKEWEDHEEK